MFQISGASARNSSSHSGAPLGAWGAGAALRRGFIVSAFALGAVQACYGASVVGHGGNCMDVRGGGTANGTNVQMWQCQAGNHNQDWTMDNGRLVWSGANKCLDVAGGGTANGTNVQIWDCQA
jgi:hypothetical protein